MNLASSQFRVGMLLAITAIFVVVNLVGLAIVQTGGFDLRLAGTGVVWLGAVGGGAYVLNRSRPRVDWLLYVIYALLSGWGVILQNRLAPAFRDRHTLWMVLATGIIVLIAVQVREEELMLLKRYRYSFLLGGVALLAGTLLFGVNPSGAGAALWLRVPVPFVRIFFQPSELLKVLLVFFLASYFAERGKLIASNQDRGFLKVLPYLAPLFLMWGFCVVLVVWQRDLGAATIFFVLFLTLLYVATGNLRYVVGGLVLFGVAAFVAYRSFDVVALRFEAWVNPWVDFDGRAFQIVQALYSIAEGGIFGEGVGQGFPTYVPVVHSDFAFSAIVEEWGVLGGVVVLVCFGLLVQRGFRVAMQQDSGFLMYVAAGLTVMMGSQAFLIMGGVTRLLPLTGVTLPFVSYGGSSLVVVAVMLGVLLRLSERVADE